MATFCNPSTSTLIGHDQVSISTVGKWKLTRWLYRYEVMRSYSVTGIKGRVLNWGGRGLGSVVIIRCHEVIIL